MSEKSEDTGGIVKTTYLRKLLQRFNEDLGQYINAEERFKLGRVLTIIDAAISDPEQRKAIKDLVQNEWWGGSSARPSETAMVNPHTDIRGLCLALGFELYPETESTLLNSPVGEDEWAKKRWTDILVTNK